ncbi:MAG TPA: carbon starvation protein A, partial [Candidatus Marinimicrobia bacterium]|nr:carbon starvation protein A [Candidatus Neomarinimicrobiota bacterium]
SMNSAYLAAIALLSFYLGYRFYSRFISDKILGLDEDLTTPAHEFNDGVDFVPTKRHILFGHHFTSIAGAAPIIGPCIAAYWGWLPALLWIIFGTIFMGAVHDFGALVVSLKEKGRSIADITSMVINPRVRLMFLIFVMLLTWLVLAVFAMAIAGLFQAVPTSILPINIEIIVALFIGYLIYKKGIDALLPSIIALGILYLFVWLGTMYPISLTSFGIASENVQTIWILFLFTYSAIASLLPVWLLLQPRDFINSHQLIVGLGLIFLGIFIAQPMIDAPAIREITDSGAPPIFPMLFVTIACGAISGFHGLVSSGTTSKQVNKLSDARLIGYGAMLGEGTLAVASTIAAVAGIALVTQCSLPSIGAVENLSWGVYYDSWAHATANKAAAFVLGGGALLEQLGLPSNLAKTLMAVLVISFAATTLDTATRIQRFIISEIGSALNFKPLCNRYGATLMAVIPAVMLTLWSVPDPVSGTMKQTAWVLWPLFGASNQMLAALTLMVLTLYFWQRKKPILPIFIPMLFIMLITFIALIIKAQSFYYQGNTLLFSINLIMIGLIIWMIFEGMLIVKGRFISKK